MVLMIFGVLTLVAAISAGPVGLQSPILVNSAPEPIVAPVYKKIAKYPVYPEYSEAPAKYEYNYAVHDEHTGDVKSHQETRHGNQVQGRYELIEPDGYKRIVEYTVDEHSGFVAKVTREPTDIKIPVPVAKLVKVAAPVTKLAYATPKAYPGQVPF